MSRWADARWVALTALLVALLAPVACDDDGPTSPSESAVVTFRVVGEEFRVLLTTPEQIAAAEAARQGGRARIPIGRLRAGTDVNVGWSWHVEEVSFAEAAIELCDGVPSVVEREGVSFGNGTYCPWSAEVIDISPT